MIEVAEVAARGSRALALSVSSSVLVYLSARLEPPLS